MSELTQEMSPEESISLLMLRDPHQLTKDDVSAITQYHRAQREQYVKAEETASREKGNTRVARAKTSPQPKEKFTGSLDDLDL